MRGVTQYGVIMPERERISIHTPHAGSDYIKYSVLSKHTLFQSTLPMRGVTYTAFYRTEIYTGFQSTLPMRGVTVRPRQPNRQNSISIHTPHAGSDFIRIGDGHRNAVFQSTLPMRGVTEGDFDVWLGADDFNPHSPCGE